MLHTVQTNGYDANNRLTIRWTPAMEETLYGYDNAGNLKNVTYQTSSNLAFSYDAMNRLASMSDGVGTTTFSYTKTGQLASETGPWAGDTVAYSYADRLRTAMSLQQPNAGAWTQTYAYDAANRLKSTVSAAGAFVYTNDPGVGGYRTASLLLDFVTLPTGAVVSNAFDGNGRILGTSLLSGATALDSSQYTYNKGNQRTQIIRGGENYVNYGYDNIGQVVKDAAFEVSGGTPRQNEQLAYVYDHAGNLTYRTNNIIGQPLVQNFQVNADNELTAQTNGGKLTVVGTTTSQATNVTVNLTNQATLYGDATFSAGQMPLLTSYTAVARDSYNRQSSYTASVALAANSSFLYDANGNLTNDGLRNFAYDDENELIQVWVPAQWMSQFRYDGRMRMRIRKEFTWTNSTFVQTNEVHYVYDGNVVIQERDANNLPHVTYTRGLDLSDSLQGAGGIGGLLARTDNPSGQSAFYHCDGNGNVTMLVNSSNAVVAKYLYDSFGNVLSSAGALASANVYRFSSREALANSSLICYLFRFYDPNMQRWLNRDPLDALARTLVLRVSRGRFVPVLGWIPAEVSVGPNGYLIVDNNTLFYIDPFGLFNLGQFVGGFGATLGGAILTVAGAGASAAGIGIPVAIGGAGTMTWGIGNMVASFSKDPVQQEQMQDCPKTLPAFMLHGLDNGDSNGAGKWAGDMTQGLLNLALAQLEGDPVGAAEALVEMAESSLEFGPKDEQ